MAMNHCIFLLMFIVSLQVAAADVTTTTTPSAKTYWNMKFPYVAMPPLLEFMLPNPAGFDYTKAKASFNRDATMALYSWYDYELETTGAQRKNKIFTSMFIREEDLLKPGTIHQLQYLGPSDLGPPFMSRNEVQTKVPFNSQHLSQILAAFSIDPSSKEAQMMKSTLNRCEDPLRFNHHFCASSMEDMVDYVSSEFQPLVASKDLNVLSVAVTPPMEVSRRYRITKVKNAGEGKDTISCHKAAFPYGAFMCHHLEGASAYRVQLQSLDNENLKVDALVGCHHDTSDWSPLYGAFEVLALKPGQTVCHFLLADNVIFIKNN